MNWLAKVIIEGETLVLGTDFVWKGDTPEEQLSAIAANVSFGYPRYQYSESDGRPGWLIANKMAEQLGGEVELNPDTDVPYYGVGKPAQKTIKSLYDSPLYKRHK